MAVSKVISSGYAALTRKEVNRINLFLASTVVNMSLGTHVKHTSKVPLKHVFT